LWVSWESKGRPPRVQAAAIITVISLEQKIWKKRGRKSGRCCGHPDVETPHLDVETPLEEEKNHGRKKKELKEGRDQKAYPKIQTIRFLCPLSCAPGKTVPRQRLPTIKWN